MRYTGVHRNTGSRVWAMCDQLPVCGVGPTEDEALQDLKNGMTLYLSEVSEEQCAALVISPVERCEGDVEFVIDPEYSHENTPPGYLPCTREDGHEGPCALGMISR